MKSSTQSGDFINMGDLVMAIKTGKKEYFGTVCEIQRNSYNILVENKMIHAKLKGNFSRKMRKLPGSW